MNFASRFPPQGSAAPPLDSAAMPTKTGGAHRGHKTREDVRERKPVHRLILDRTQAGHVRGDTRERTPRRATLQAKVATAGGAATRAADAHTSERGSDKKWGPPTWAADAYTVSRKNPHGHKGARRRQTGACPCARPGRPLA